MRSQDFPRQPGSSSGCIMQAHAGKKQYSGAGRTQRHYISNKTAARSMDSGQTRPKPESYIDIALHPVSVYLK